MKRQLLATVGLAAAITLVVAGTGQSAPPPTATPSAAVGPVAAGTYTITLVTGDVVSMQRNAGGKQAVTVRPGPGRERIGFHQMEVDGELSVIPLDAIPYLGSGALDRALFNLTKLIAAGYDDARRGTLPLILDFAAGTDLRRQQAQPFSAHAATTRVLESIGAVAVTADKAEAAAFWESVDDDAAAVAEGKRQPELAGGVRQVRLDRPVRASLDRSVAQVGAPQAWQAGLDGTGVTVAVLDTGVDQTHPDLAGVVLEARSFSDSPDARDGHGHGTHVSSIIAGRGVAAANRRGVAPGARLLVGKVLSDSGSGQESWIIDGMEWAAGAGATVVNLSLGGEATDGSDAMSQAVNRLTAQHGTLFVISAGNSGPGEFTVGSPGAATTALTVGAVDRDESLAGFSSRGPRLGDFAVKPDITAPGIDIVAARASGTTMGRPVDASYTAASGTSMAAPHVAGAAAILAQQHPEWTAQQLKDALASTAVRNPSLTVDQQGGGRLDVARATRQAVTGTGTLDLGQFPHDGTGAAYKTVTYRNTSASPVELDLRLGTTVTGLRLAQDSVTVPAGGEATVDVVVDLAALTRGRGTGYLEATAGDVAVHTSLGWMKEAPRHRVTFTARGHDGRPTDMSPLTMFGEDRRFDLVTQLVSGQSRTVEVAEGTYFLFARNDSGIEPDREETVIVDPSLQVDRDLRIVLDARKANRVSIRTPEPAVQRGALSHVTFRQLPNGRRIWNGAMVFDSTRYLSVTPTPTVTSGAFEFNSRWSLVAPLVTTSLPSHPEFSPDLFMFEQSPTIDGTHQLPVVHVGRGRPADYQRHEVRGKIALISGQPVGTDYRVLIQDAAAAGAAMALITPAPGEYVYTIWHPAGDRVAIPAALTRPAHSEQLQKLLERGNVTMELRGQFASPYLYDVLQVSKDSVPEQVVHEVSDLNSATVTTPYHRTGDSAWALEQRFGWRPWQEYAINHRQRWMGVGTTREEIVSAGDISWQHRVKYDLRNDLWNELQGGMTNAIRTYRPGERVQERWYAPIARPGVPDGRADAAPYREGDSLDIRLPVWSDSTAGHYGLPEGGGLVAPGDEGDTRLFRDGELVAEQDWPWGAFAVGAEPATYRLEVDVARNSPGWQFATRTETAWTFRSARSDTRRVLPMLQLDYGVSTDLRNRVQADREQSMSLSVRYPDGLPEPRLSSLQAWVSYDDGASWHSTQVDPDNGQFRVRLDLPQLDLTNGYVSLRVRATDQEGGAVDQTVSRAFGLR